MAGLAAGIRHERQRRRAVERGGGGGRDVDGDHDPLAREALERVLGLAEEVLEDALRDVAQVHRALPQVLVVDLLEGPDVAGGHPLETALDVAAGLLELAHRLADEGLVLEDQQVRVENGGLLGPEVALHLGLDAADLLAGRDQRAVEARDLVDPALRLDLVIGNLELALQVEEHLAVRDPLRGGDALHGELVAVPGFHH